VKELSKKVLFIAIVILAVIMLSTPLVSAQVWNNNMNNDKFQSYYVIHENLPVTDIEVDYKPNEENPNVIVYSWGDNIGSYEIVIGGEKHYFRDVDFAYEQDCVWTAIGAPFINVGGVIMGSKSNIWRIVYKFDFSAVQGGIDGTLEMLFVYNNGKLTIRSLRGTGDLQNVQILATAILGEHMGIVSGWPE
jgi:hypothetical protein